MPERIHIKSPFIQVAGGAKYQIDFETTADQVKTGDGGDLDLRLRTLERAVAGVSSTHFSADIAARDALISVNTGDTVFVQDASGDETVTSGAATYLKQSDGSYLKIAEAEAMDVELGWADIQDGPAADVKDIDRAAQQAHAHVNAEVLAKLAEKAGELFFNGLPVHPHRKWIVKAKTIDDVDKAELADTALVFVEETPDCNCDCEGCENDAGGGAQVYLFHSGTFEMLDIMGKGNLLPVYASAFSISENGMLCVDDTQSGGLKFKITNNGYLEASNNG